MRFGRGVVAIVVFLVSTIVCSTVALAGDCDYCVCKGNDTVNSCTKCCAAAQKDGGTITELQLRISDDGKAIVDQNGKDVARFVKGTRVQVTTKGVKANSQKIQGCWRCYPVCVIWEGNRCVEWMRTCDWDFDCNTLSGAQSNNTKIEKSTDTPKIIERELTPDTGEYMKTPCYKTERYCTEWLPDGKCKLWDSRQVQVPC